MRIIGAQGDSSGAEGVLVRKHDWESTTKKAANRSWDKVCSTDFLAKKIKYNFHDEIVNSMIFNIFCYVFRNRFMLWLVIRV